VQADSTAFTIAVLPTLDCLPLFLASEHGMFQRSGINVRLVPFYAQMDQDTALQNGRVKAIVTDLVRVEHLRRKQMSVSYLTSTDASWRLVSSRTARIRQLPQLNDKMIAMTRYSATDMLSELITDSARLKPEKVFCIQVNDVRIRRNMVQLNTIDAALLPEPQATAALQQRAFPLLDASGFNLRLGVIASREEALTDTETEAFKKAYNEACDSLNTYGIGSYRNLIVKHMEAPLPTIDSLSAQAPTFQHASLPRTRDIERAKAWLNQKIEKENVEKQPIQ
jgi:NitT/TauT family transport system substrate-binding protein